MALELAPALLEKITGYSLDDFSKHHIPISIYVKEMGSKADLLREHKDIYQEELGFDSVQLANDVDKIKLALLAQEMVWVDGEKERNARAAFWFNNKERLYTTNQEVTARLDFHFTLTNNTNGLKVLDDIGTSDNDNDAVYDGHRIGNLFELYGAGIPASLYTEDQIEEFKDFYATIAEAQEVADLDRTAPHEDRILRDQIYLHLRSLESLVLKAADAALVHKPKERVRYRSEYIRQKNLDYNAKLEAQKEAKEQQV